MEKNKIEDWMKFLTFKEEQKLYKDTEVDQEISHNMQHVYPKGYSLAHFVYTVYKETKHLYLPC